MARVRPEAEASTGEQTDGPGVTEVQGETPPSGDGVGAGADGGAAAAEKVAAEARERAEETTAAPAGGTVAASGASQGLDASPAGPGVPVHDRDATPEGARQSTGTDPRPPRSARPRQSAEAIDLLDTAGAPVAKRVVPVLVGAVVLVVVLRRLLR